MTARRRRRRRPISERDYLIATDLAKARIAYQAMSSLSACVRHDLGMAEAFQALRDVIDRLEKLVQGDEA